MTNLHDYTMPPSLCPYCGHFCDAVTEAREGEGSPKPGDYSVCIECCGTMKFGEKLELLKVSDEEEDAIEPACKQALEKAKMAIRFMQYLNPPADKPGKGN